MPTAAATITMTEQECRELLDVGKVGRVGFRHPSGLQLLLVRYAVDDDTVVFATTPDDAFAVLAGGADDVVFEVDYHNTVSGTGWSVMMNGRVEPAATDGADDGRPTSWLVPWPGGDGATVLRFRPRSIKGRRVCRRTG